MSTFDKLVGIKSIINVLRTCCHLVASTNDDNDVCWFFTFTNKLIGLMKGGLLGQACTRQEIEGEVDDSEIQ